MPFGASPWQLIIVLLIVLVVFGAKRLPEIGRSLGSGAREFKAGITGEAEETESSKPEALSASASPEEDGK